MRYIKKQWERSSCCPIAVMNVLKHLGASVSYKEFVSLFEALYYKYVTIGVRVKDTTKLLGWFNIKHVEYKKPSVETIERELDNDNIVLLFYVIYGRRLRSRWGHIIMIHGHTKHKFKSLNGHSSKKFFKKNFTMTQDLKLAPCMWSIPNDQSKSVAIKKACEKFRETIKRCIYES